jgi:hypothetical protein
LALMPNAPFDKLKPMSFIDVEFPYENYSVQGGIRRHKHEFPHNPGGAVEKLGRELYEIHVSVSFTAGLTSPTHQDLLLLRLPELVDAFEQQLTGPLHIPHIGTIQACADRWTQTARNTNRSTIRADFSFFEDLNSALALNQTVVVRTQALESLAEQFNIARVGVKPGIVPKAFAITPTGESSIDIFDAVADLSVAIAGIKDQQELFGALVSSKLEGLIALFKQCDRQLASLNDPGHWPLLDAMHALWAAALQVRADLQDTGHSVQIYLTPTPMGIADVSVALYGNTSSAAQLMQLNDLDDPLHIPQYTEIIYYAAVEAAA